MERNIIWSAWDEPGLEHLHLVLEDEQILADGMILRVKDGIPFRARYNIRCDPDWSVRAVELSLLDSSREDMHLYADGKGHWRDGSGNAIAGLAGCLDVDISITPFTNSLPVRRLKLEQGASADLLAAYIAVPEMEVKPSRQRYTCIESSPEGGLYRYEDEGLFRSFTALLPVDADGLVLDYPELFRRIWSG
jgi:uncharacterized protein